MKNASQRGLNTAVGRIIQGAVALAWWSRRLRFYGLALLLVAAAALLRWSLPDVLGPTPFLVFYLAWVAAAAFGGLGPGLLATAASWLCVDLFFDATPWQTNFGDPATLGRLLVLLAGGTAVSLVAERMRRGRIRERQSQEQYRSLFENMLDGYAQCRMLWDKDGRPADFVYLNVNDAFGRLTGLQNVIGKRVTEVIPGIRESDPEPFEVYGRVARTGRPERLEIEVEPLGIWFSISVYSSQRGYFTAVFDNITQRKRAEEELKQLAQQRQLALDAARMGWWHYDPVTRVASWDDRYKEIFGITGSQRPNEEILARLHPDDLPGVWAKVEAALDPIHPQPYAVQYRIRHPDGSARWIEAHGIASFAGEGETRHATTFIGTVADITERRQAEETLRRANEQLQQQTEELQAQSEELQMQAEELTTSNEELRESEQALRESEERFRAAYEQAAIGIEMLDLQGRFLRGNGWLSLILGYREDELQRRTFAQITHPDDLPEELPRVEGLLAGRTPNYSIEKRYLHKDGHPVWVRVTSSLVRTSTPYRISIIEDVTERRRSEEALRELNATLEDKVAQRTAELEHRARQLQKLTLELSETEGRERRRLAEVLHDDLQQVLAAAKFHLGLLSARVKDDPSQQAIATRVNQMLVDAIAKSRSLSHDLSPAVLHHDDFTETLRWLAGRVQAQHGLTVHVDAPEEVKMASDTLRSFLYKAAQELLFNVVKHARVKDARIRVRQFGRYIGLSVCDHGRGFDPKEVRQTAGFGLLSIRERVELLGGRMTTHSTKGKGSTFYLVVPNGQMTEDEGPAREDGRQRTEDGLPSSVLRPPSSGPVLRVLLADDHEIVREGLISLLSEAGDVEVVGEASNGREAINQACQLQPDVVIMDVAMPLINGGDATRQIKMRLPKTRVIALSMYEEAEMRETMYRAGAESYVLKTAPSEELLSAIRGKPPRL